MQEKFGQKSVMMAAQMPRYPKISTGSLALDFATGVGGWPSDRYVEVFGAESCGKTTLGLIGMKNFLDAQPKRGAVILDTEHKMDLDWAARITGDDYMKTRIIYLQPDSIEDATEMYKECVSDGSTAYVLFDSIASAQTRKSVTTEKDEMTGNAKAMAGLPRSWPRSAPSTSAARSRSTRPATTSRASTASSRRAAAPPSTPRSCGCT
jgi:recombination protein RecA